MKYPYHIEFLVSYYRFEYVIQKRKNFYALLRIGYEDISEDKYIVLGSGGVNLALYPEQANFPVALKYMSVE